MKKLILIDANALIHRAFHALPPLKSPAGIITNAVYGFSSTLLKMLKDLEPDYIVAAYDLPGPTFRHKAYEKYKIHRAKAPAELYSQIPYTKKVLEGFGIPSYEMKGFEADDIIGTLADKFGKEKDLKVIVVTGDLDTLQLVKDKKIVVYTMKKGLSDTVIYDEGMVKERYGLKPEQLTDYKGLKGDPSDNIPGVPGIGDKTASELLKEYASIENLYKCLKSENQGLKQKEIKESLKKKLLGNEEQARFSKELAMMV
ncbi:MAG: DNA polymerase I, partial [Parcubacteria group bacterium]|nr:DNA polymerase I [Parcubacteria group bacterium]